MEERVPVTETPIDELLTEEKIGPRDGAGRLAVVAMSGGVDSAVSALLMRERGYRVVGMNLRLFSPADPVHAVNPCCGIPAMDDARATCSVIGVPFYAINMEAEFGEAVIDRFVDEYASGRTPNPCLECNRHVKFRHLVHRAKLLGADCLATGHYARIEPGEPYRLYRAVDARKDQSYVLHTLTPEQLAFIQFPLGALTKPEVRRLARHFGLPVADKEESQEICFVGKGSYADFVAKRRPDVTKPGQIVDEERAPIGQHDGLVHHTIGQRRGIRIAGPKPLYVLELDTARNQLVVGARERAVARSVTADGVTFTSGSWPQAPFTADAVVRYRGVPVPCEVAPATESEGTVSVRFLADTGELPIASPGQAIVFYLRDEVLGGGTIRTVTREVVSRGDELEVAG
ncbi:MAG: tRNA 2-thiouridine(34) synthase MnmA [Chloroflexota bacterium]|nr:tRNA 2-thiouridine(34) synthase MnmA [Chloroflexota bacterium]